MKKNGKKYFYILSVIPEAIKAYTQASILGRAQKKGLIKVECADIRRWTRDAHKTVDDAPFGGGPGMVLKVGSIYEAVTAIRSKIKNKKEKTRIILFSTRGKLFDEHEAQRLSKYDRLILICGRYEGVDERVATYVADEELSVGDAVLSGGELPALMVVDAIARKVPGVLGKEESLEENKGSYPVFTRPQSFVPKKGLRAWNVPEVLLSGDHKRIEKWREENGKR